MAEIDNAITAAWIDGEGCISIAKVAAPKKYKLKNYRYQLAIYVSNSDRRICDWMQEKHGGKIYERTSKRYKFYNWILTGKAAEDLLNKCLKYFIIKREQADIALEFQANKGILPIGTNTPVPTELLEIRDEYWKRMKASKKAFYEEI